jgi:MFS family permease
MNFVVGFGVTAAVIKIFPGSGVQRAETFDVWGSVALLAGYPSMLVGLTFSASLGWTSAWVLGWFALAAIGLASFIWIEGHTAKPLVDVTIFRSRILAAAMVSVILGHMISYPVALAAPLYLQNVLGASAVVSGLLLAILPLSTALASPLSGRLADCIDASTVAGFGVAMIVAGIACYSRLGTETQFFIVAVVLALLGAGVGFFTPANQKLAFGSVAHEDYGVLAAMLSSFGTAAGTIGTTIVVALMEMDSGGNLWASKEIFSNAQRFAFAWLVPIGLLAIGVAFRSRRSVEVQGSAKSIAGR